LEKSVDPPLPAGRAGMDMRRSSLAPLQAGEATLVSPRTSVSKS